MKNAVILENVYGFNSVKATDIRIISSFLFLCKQTSHTQAHLNDTLSLWVRQFLRIKLFASSKTTFNSIQFQWEMYSSMKNKKIIKRLFHTCVAYSGDQIAWDWMRKFSGLNHTNTCIYPRNTSKKLYSQIT